MAKKVYLAGPEVFLPNARQMLDRKASLTRAAGLIPLSPGDLEIPPTNSKRERAAAISAVDERMMLEADAIIANLTPFRGIAADTGTTFELGFMCALGKPVFAYTNVARDHAARVVEHFKGAVQPDPAGQLRDPGGLSVEDFGLIDNLMLHAGIERRGGVVIVGDARPDAIYTDLAAFETCLDAAASKLSCR
ncbi:MULTISPECIES: nucleoside 2-deoxyribosyltransferase [Sinorhizobium]|uniref:Nucleoside 2-deoxyribosyltransferase n=1 Tax=Sinorhizobium americanum TaxID=194963 RepID=A0A2S3YGB3_9HYPH|nr:MULTISPECIES: nucleoside 2-deoxyribosyltransferase [Sinorhizobium]PDT40191.1 nucleoside 2-deoxyribosyltransferase [Sinorhizobium sp. FG01]POH25276.1 nucleoside 2-deoxyribosyltransferase [Sinorhizobium americanum]